jgi:Domain of Unknown Function (DUF349)
MSLFSRLFRKAPSPSLPPEKVPVSSPPPARPEASAPDRAVVSAQEERELEAAIAASDAVTISRLVVQGSSTKVRQQAAQAVHDPEQLRQLIKDVRGGNDKSVYKILTGKRDVMQAQAREVEQLRAEISAAAAAIERHSHRPYDPVFTPTLEQLQLRWNALAAQAEPDMQQKVQQAIDRAREVIAQHLREIAVAASRELAAANAAAEAERVRELEQRANATAAAERAAVLEAERKARAEKHEAEAMALRQVGGLIRKASLALGDGSTGRAAGLRRAIEEKLAGAPPLPGHMTNQLQQLDKKLADLKDWKSFTVAPKRIELMEEMESLIDATLEPQALADRIRQLQEEWRTLSKGVGENLEADWQRFQEAAQKAYLPCKAFFETQAQERQENLQRREALLQRLSAFESGHDWEHPDWRTVIVALRESKQEWRRHSPVERAAGKAVQEKFDAVSASLQARLDGEYERNLQEKKSLVDRAQRLVAAEDSRKAIDDVKVLQQKWKEVGLVPRDAGQSFGSTATPCSRNGSRSTLTTTRAWRPTRRRPWRCVRSWKALPPRRARTCWQVRPGSRTCGSRSRARVSFRARMRAACRRGLIALPTGARRRSCARRRGMPSAVGLTFWMRRIGCVPIVRPWSVTLTAPSRAP